MGSLHPLLPRVHIISASVLYLLYYRCDNKMIGKNCVGKKTQIFVSMFETGSSWELVQELYRYFMDMEVYSRYVHDRTRVPDSMLASCIPCIEKAFCISKFLLDFSQVSIQVSDNELDQSHMCHEYQVTHDESNGISGTSLCCSVPAQ